jgi:hypothetical protein
MEFSMETNINTLHEDFYLWITFVLFGFRPNPALHFVRLSSNHSDDYAFSDNRPNCLAGFTLNSEPFMKYAGSW